MFLDLAGRGERERDVSCTLYAPQLKPATLVCALTGNQTCSLLVHRTILQPMNTATLGGSNTFFCCRKHDHLKILNILITFAIRWVVGQVPSGGHVRGNHTLMFLSLQKNKILKNNTKIK